MAFFVYKYVHSSTQLTNLNHHFGIYMKLRYLVLCSQVPKLVVHVLSIIPGTLQNSFFFFQSVFMLEVTPRLWNFRDEWGGTV